MAATATGGTSRASPSRRRSRRSAPTTSPTRPPSPHVERWRRWFTLGVVVAGGVLVLGPVARLRGWDIPLPYRALYALIPGFASLRYPYRFGTLTTLGIALLAGLGWARLVGGR